MIKRVLITTLLLSVMLTSLGSFNNVAAETIISYNANQEEYPYACSLDYEIDYINDDGTFKLVECYSDFNSAKAKMKENEDYVVRHYNGYSPSKIVAMNSGLAYSYNRGYSDVVINIYEGVKGLADNTHTYVDRYFQMNYIDTNYMSSVSGCEGQGYIHIVLNGFEGYADLEYTDLVPSKFIDKKIPIYLGGSYGGNGKSPYKVICEPDYYKIEKNGNYNDLVLYYHNAYPKNASNGNYNAECWSMSVGNANDFKFLQMGTAYYSSDAFNFYDSYKINKRNLIGTGYNYYQYLPLRTKSNILASILDNFLISVKGANTDSVIKGLGSVFVQGQTTYGSNAAIVFAMACWESSYGTSPLSKQAKNLFGWRAYDSDPSQAYVFNSVNDCILEHAGGNLRDYSDIYVNWFNGAYLGNKGSGFNLKYASDPYWGAGISSIYYRLDKFSCGNNGNLTDYNTSDYGVVKTLGASVYADSSCKKELFKCKYSDTRNLNYVVSIIQDCGNTYKVQLSNPIVNGALLSRVDGKYAYDWNNSIGYIKKTDISFIKNNGEHIIVNNENVVIDTLDFNDGNMIIEGVGIITNCDFTNSNDVTHKINIYNLKDNTLVSTIDCENVDSSWFNINDGNKYTYGGFKSNIDMSKLANGSYMFKLLISAKCNGSVVTKETIIKSTLDEHRSKSNKVDTIAYRISANDVYNYRIELEKSTYYENIDTSNINKPTVKTSMATVDVVSYDDSIMNIKGVGMIYYLNYLKDNTSHTLYLVNDKHIYELETSSVTSEINYQEFYNSKYKMDYITYNASIDCKDIQSGSYRLVLEIKNDSYLDYCELTNEFDYTYDSLSLEKLSTNYSIDTIRTRMLFNINNMIGE